MVVLFFIFSFYTFGTYCSEKNFLLSIFNQIFDPNSKSIYSEKPNLSVPFDIATKIISYLFPILSMHKITSNPKDTTTYFKYEELVTFKKLIHSILLLNKAFYNAFQNYDLQSYFKKHVNLYRNPTIYKDQIMIGHIIIQSPAEYTINLTTHFLTKSHQEYLLWFEYSLCFYEKGNMYNLIKTFFNVHTPHHAGISHYYNNCANNDIPKYIAQLENIRSCKKNEIFDLPCISFRSPILHFLLNFMKSENYTWGLKQYGSGSNQIMYYVYNFMSGPFIKKINRTLVIDNPLEHISLFGLKTLLKQNKIHVTYESIPIINTIMDAQPDTENTIPFKQKIKQLIQVPIQKNNPENESWVRSRMQKEMKHFNKNSTKESLTIFNMNKKQIKTESELINLQMPSTKCLKTEKLEDYKINKNKKIKKVFIIISLSLLGIATISLLLYIIANNNKIFTN